MKYIYSTKHVGISGDGVHLLRKHFPFHTIPLAEIEKVELKKGMQLNNWPLILLLGGFLVTPGIYMIVHLKEAFAINDAFSLGVRIIYYGAIPLVGIYFVYEALQYGPVLEINYRRNKVKRFHLEKFSRHGSDELSQLMKPLLGTRFVNRLD